MEGDLAPAPLWLAGAQGQGPIDILDEASVSQARERVRAEGAALGMPATPIAELVNVASELAHNQLRHAARGTLLVRAVRRGEQLGLEVVAADRGPGIADVARALEGRPSRPGSLGVGLSAVFELADEVDVDVRLGEGTCVWARKFGKDAPRRPRVGIYGRPYPGERLSGDDAAFVRADDALLLGVLDGLGHGEPAREAAARGARRLLSHGDAGPESLLADCHPLLSRTRGAVMTAVRLEPSGDATVAGVGNVSARRVGTSAPWRFGGSSYVLGAPSGVHKITTERVRLEPRDVLVVFTDGIRSRHDLGDDRDLLREHPIVIAQRFTERFARPDDDVLVAVIG